MNIFILENQYGGNRARHLYDAAAKSWGHLYPDDEEAHKGLCLMCALTFVLIKLDLV
jgi:hypothetical protein